MRTVLLLPLVSILLLLQAPAQDTPAAKPAAPAWKATDAYPLDTCVVSGRPFAGDTMKVVEVEGRKFKLCSTGCEEKLRKDSQGYLAKLDSAVVDAQLADYPLDTCPISGKKLGSMGEPVKLVLDNHLVQLCCKGCTAKAKAKKDEIVRSIATAAYDKQKDSYPLKTCLNTGEELDPKGMIEVMHGPTLLRFCCKDCLDELDKAPAAMLGKLQAARKVKGTGEARKPATGQPPHKHGGGEDGKPAPGSGHQGHGSGQGSGGGGCCGGGGCGR
ncbi:MAG: hypothetical protein WAT39_21085 [Planctomycetota bacterium]